MSEPITVSDARKALRMLKEVGEKATPGDWFEHGGQIRSLWDHDGRNIYVARSGDMDRSTVQWILAARAVLPGMVDGLLQGIENYHGPDEEIKPDGYWYAAVAPIVEWARKQEGWTE